MKSHSTILSIIFGFLVINLFINNDYLVYFIILILGLSIASKKFSDSIEIFWFSIAVILSKILPSVLLSIIYFMLLTPLAYMSKLFNAQTDYKSKNNLNSMFTDCNKNFTKKSFEKTW
tara:strand:+ start:409 stop:762 length:354 start_codon:yes stop_codon:yes gene_type:complete